MRPTAKEAEKRPRVVGRPPTVDDGEARIRILEAAIDTFAETGVAASSIKAISLRAGCTPALIHYHFTDKETLVGEALEIHVLPVMRRFWETADLGLKPADTLMEMVRRVLKSSKKTPWFLSIWSREVANEGGVLRSFLRDRIGHGAMARFREIVEAGQRDGTVNPDLSPELVYVSLISAACLPALGRVTWGRIFGRTITDQDLDKHVLGMVTQGLAVRNERSSHESGKLGNRRPGGGLQGGFGRRRGRRPVLGRRGSKRPSRRRSGKRS
jgi:AcrR family transcriptional regulator